MNAEQPPDAIKLAEALVQHDEEKRRCPYCSKDKWGKEWHDKYCPFALAYRLLEKKSES